MGTPHPHDAVLATLHILSSLFSRHLSKMIGAVRALEEVRHKSPTQQFRSAPALQSIMLTDGKDRHRCDVVFPSQSLCSGSDCIGPWVNCIPMQILRSSHQQRRQELDSGLQIPGCILLLCCNEERIAVLHPQSIDCWHDRWAKHNLSCCY